MHRFIQHGKNTDVQTTTDPEDVYDGGGQFPFQTAAAATNVVSANAADAAAGTGVRTLLVKGSDGDDKFIEEIVTLDGTTQVNLTNQFKHVICVEALTVGSGGVAAGAISVRHGATVINQIEAGAGISHSAVLCGFSNLKLTIEQVDVHIRDNTPGTCRFELLTKKVGGPWVDRWSFTAEGQSLPGFNKTFKAKYILEAGEIVRLVAAEVSANMGVEGTIEAMGDSGPVMD